MDGIVNKKRKTASQNELRSLIEAQQCCCALSGVAVRPDTAELDHVNPIASGGSNTIDNLQVLHVTVNRMKGTMSNREFITWCRIIASTADI